MTSRNRGFVKEPGAKSQGNLKFDPKWHFVGPGRSSRPLILHVLGPRWRLGSPALRLPPQASQGPTAPTQPRTCTYMYIAWHARYGRAFEPRGASAQRTAARRHARRFACTPAGALAACERVPIAGAGSLQNRWPLWHHMCCACVVHVLCMCCACAVLCCAMLCSACAVQCMCMCIRCACVVHVLCMCCDILCMCCAVLCCAVHGLCCACPVHMRVLCTCCMCSLCMCMCYACAVHAISLETVALKNASVSTSARCSRMTPSTSPYIRKQYVPLCIVCPIDAPVEGRGWKLEGEGKHTPYANDVRGKHEAREAGSQGARSQQHEASDMNCCCLSIQASTSNVG